MFPWDKAINRAQQLAETATPAKELLNFYATLLEAQKEIYESLRGRRHWLPSGSLPDDIPNLKEYLLPFLESVAAVAPPALAEQAAHLISSEALDEMLLQYWQERSDEQFFAKALLQPYAQWLVQSRPVNRDFPRAENRCPFCSGKPQVSFLQVTDSTSESGNRNLICATCLSAWEFRRVVCASCGEERPFKLGYFQANEYDHVRIEVCESCRQYIKSIDLTRFGFAVPLVDDVATAALDLWAAEKGYAKIELNLVGL
jgi:FdhE protein